MGFSFEVRGRAGYSKINRLKPVLKGLILVVHVTIMSFNYDLLAPLGTFMTMTQTERVFLTLQKNRTLTSAEAFSLLGVLHLPRRVKDLRELGVLIDSEQVGGLNRHGSPCHWTVYKLNKASPIPECFTKPVEKSKKAKHDFYLLGLLKAAKILIDSADLEAAKAALGSEIRRRAKRETAKVRGS